MSTTEQDVELEPDPVDLTGLPPEQVRDWYRSMERIRQFETLGEDLVPQGRLVGGMHSARGQEATAVGIVGALRSTDVITGTHRSHHVTLAKGLPPREVMAELMGKATGAAGGRGGHMHLVDLERGHYGSNAIVGGAVGIALGVAFAQRYRRQDAVAVGFVGDGGINVGRLWEFANLAAVWELPLVIVCENNLYAVETPISASMAGSMVARAEAFGLAACSVDGQDVAATYRAGRAAVERARSSGGPSFIEARTYRFSGHDVGDRETYRTREEVEQWQQSRDPLARLRAAMEAAGTATSAELELVQAEIAEELQEALAFAEQSPFPGRESRYDNVYGIDPHLRGNR